MDCTARAPQFLDVASSSVEPQPPGLVRGNPSVVVAQPRRVTNIAARSRWRRSCTSRRPRFMSHTKPRGAVESLQPRPIPSVVARPRHDEVGEHTAVDVRPLPSRMPKASAPPPNVIPFTKPRAIAAIAASNRGAVAMDLPAPPRTALPVPPLASRPTAVPQQGEPRPLQPHPTHAPVLHPHTGQPQHHRTSTSAPVFAPPAPQPMAVTAQPFAPPQQPPPVQVQPFAPFAYPQAPAPAQPAPAQPAVATPPHHEPPQAGQWAALRAARPRCAHAVGDLAAGREVAGRPRTACSASRS